MNHPSRKMLTIRWASRKYTHIYRSPNHNAHTAYQVVSAVEPVSIRSTLRTLQTFSSAVKHHTKVPRHISSKHIPISCTLESRRQKIRASRVFVHYTQLNGVASQQLPLAF